MRAVRVPILSDRCPTFGGSASVLSHVRRHPKQLVADTLLVLFLDSSLGLIEQCSMALNVSCDDLASALREVAITVDAAGILLVENYSSPPACFGTAFHRYRALQRSLEETEIHLIDVLRISGDSIHSASSLR